MSLLEYLPIIVLIWLPITVYYLCLYDLNYWKRQGIKHVQGLPIIGNLLDLILHRKSVFDHFYSICHNEKCVNQPIIGYHMLHKKALIVCEPELIKRIFIEDFKYFHNRHSSSNLKTDIMGAANLLFLRNAPWREMRKRLSPIFSYGHMRKFYPLIEEIGQKLNDMLKRIVVEDGPGGKVPETIVNFKEISASYTTDVIASCAFGVYANSLDNPNNEFRNAGHAIHDVGKSWLRSIEMASFFMFPEIVPIFKFQLFPKKVQAFFRKSIHDIMEKRRNDTLGENNKSIRNDLIDTLVVLQNEDSNKCNTTDELPFKDDVLVAQAAIFIGGGFETNASVISFTIYELAWNQDIQNRLREEIRNVLNENNNKKADEMFDVINKMIYLQMVVSEALRKYPILPFLDRVADVPAGENGYSLAPYHKFEIPNGMPVIIPIYAIHRNPKHYPEPNCFDPERFAPQNLHKIKPYTYMPFGLGPHRCVAENFGLLLVKVAIFNIVKNNHLTPSIKSPKNVKFCERAFTISQANGNYLRIEKLTQN